MRILVTGGTGFIGSHLVSRLLREYVNVRVLCRRAGGRSFPNSQGVEITYGDLKDEQSVSQAVSDVQVVFHLAAATSGTWEEYFQSTVMGTRRILETSARAGVNKFIYVSSLSVYGLNSLQHGSVVKEDSPLEPKPEARGFYARAKVEAERIVLEFMRDKALPISVLRPAIVYGPGRPFSSGVAHCVKDKLFIILGDGHQIVPLVYVDDLVEALILAMRNHCCEGEIYNVVDPASPTQREYLAKYQSLLDIKIPTVFVPLSLVHAGASVAERVLSPIMPERFSCLGYRLRRFTKQVLYDSTKIQRDLGWIPRVPFEEGLKRAIKG